VAEELGADVSKKERRIRRPEASLFPNTVIIEGRSYMNQVIIDHYFDLSKPVTSKLLGKKEMANY
jgi:hypothetical protein